MDTLTHITVGAAIGEVVLGRKLGNRAMIWGAFGGILPDFDVMANIFTNEIAALAFHRGPTHSILFLIIAAYGLTEFVRWLYESGHFKRPWYKKTVFVFLVFLMLVVAGTLNYVTYSPKNGINLEVLAGTLAAVIWLVWLTWKKYYRAHWEVLSASRREWLVLFLLSLFSHTFLDCFTSYGTQIFLPFSNYAVAVNNIAVLDPLFTFPFLICVAIATFIQKNKKTRHYLISLGFTLCAAYMVFTLYNKRQSDQIFQKALAEKGIVYQRFTTSPTLLNNFLWQGVAEGDSVFYHASYTLLDEEPYIRDFNILAKDQELVAAYSDDKVIRVLNWFTRGYYSVLDLGDNKYQINDLRYGSTEENFSGEDKYVFRFIVEDKNGKLSAHQIRAYHRISWEGLVELYERIKGRQ